MKIAIAPAVGPEDVAAVKDLFREYVFRLEREHGLTVAYQDFAGEMDTFPERYARLWLARVEEAPAAAIGLKRLAPGEGEIKRLYARDAFRGLGLGARLVERLMTDARAMGLHTLRLDTHASLGHAIRLYESFGFLPSPPHNEPGNACTLFFARSI